MHALVIDDDPQLRTHELIKSRRLYLGNLDILKDYASGLSRLLKNG